MCVSMGTQIAKEGLTQHIRTDVHTDPIVTRVSNLIPTETRPAANVQQEAGLLGREVQQLNCPFSHLTLNLNHTRAISRESSRKEDSVHQSQEGRRRRRPLKKKKKRRRRRKVEVN